MSGKGDVWRAFEVSPNQARVVSFSRQDPPSLLSIKPTTNNEALIDLHCMSPIDSVFTQCENGSTTVGLKLIKRVDIQCQWLQLCTIEPPNGDETNSSFSIQEKSNYRQDNELCIQNLPVCRIEASATLTVAHRWHD